METDDRANKTLSQDRHVLIALDGSENAERALLYAADFLGGVPGFRATLIRIINEPSEDYFDAEEDMRKWIEDESNIARDTLDKYRNILVQSGFDPDKVDVKVEVRNCPSIADCILDEQKRLGCCTVIIGRRGKSKKEEFIFGSTSSKIVHNGKNCAVWVIE